ncbi:hypothetical protein SAMN05443244_1784 [Terriglobus roseus]|uniref:Uncharacterized protein n=2 Tax=Terriglobus roseus TaxID=392734 RepID=A0A1H4M109_9BACT|nr:hypothetical protein SAMN05443244_1784 [Terriglobus roseus]
MTPAESRRAAADARREAAAEAAAEAAPVRRSGRNAVAGRLAASHAPAERGTPDPSPAARSRRAAVAETRMPAPAKAPEESAADRAMQDRVHAWYQSHGLAMPAAPAPSAPAAEKPVKAVRPAGRVTVADSEDAGSDDGTAAPIVRMIAPTAKPRTVAHTSPAPDLSPEPRKATVADFDRALQQKNQAIRAAAVEAQAHTTADDDAAEASTQIPGTAPTERVALPFTHGDLLTASATSGDLPLRQATLTTPKSENPDKHLNKHTDADVLENSADALTATDGKRPNVRAISEQTAMAPTQKLQLPKPIAMAHGATPAVSAVNAAGKKQQVDPQTVAGLTDETFDDNSDPITTARSAVTMAAKSFKTAPVSDLDDDAMRATTSTVKVNLYNDRGKLMMIPAMKGTHEILVHQNQMAVADGLDRIEDDDQLLDMRRYKLLVALPDNEALQVDDRLPSNRRYARPWSVRFLNDLSRAHYTRFGTPLIVTSAARTVEFQKRLVRINGNAAPPTGDIASPHLYGQAVDIAKHGMSVTEIAWMRAYLTPVETEGKIDVEEEFQQACFHISIYRRYLGLPARKHTTPADPLPERTLQQVKATPDPVQKHRRLPTSILATGLR